MNGTKIDNAVKSVSKYMSSKQTRSTVFLIIAFILILAVNSILPVIEGDAHYTVEAVEVTYSEYLDMKEDNSNYRLSWLSEVSIKQYKERYIAKHPELTPEEESVVNVPDNFKVKVYTKFFYQYVFWYISTITSLASAIILFYSIFNFLIVRAKDHNPKYLELTEEMDDLSDKHLDPVTFETWIEDVFNYNRKIHQHKMNVKYALDSLNRWTSYKVKRKFREYYKHPRDSEESNKALASLGKLTRAEAKYFSKREKLLDLLAESYIKEYVVSGKVKYFKYIYPMFVYNGSNSVGKTVDSYSLIKSDAGRLTSDAGNKISLSITITVLFAILLTVTAVASYEQSTFWLVVNMISKIAPLLIQIPFAIDYSNVYMDTHLISNLISRRSISFLYLADQRKVDATINISPQLQATIDEEVKENAEKN